MTDFPFTKLPVLVQLDVVKKMWLRDVFERTTLYPEIKNLVKTVKPNATKLKWNIRGNEGFSIILYTDRYICPSSGKNFEFRFGVPNVAPEDVPRKMINGVEIPIQEHRGIYKVMCTRDYKKRIEAMEHITRHLMDIFKIENFHLDTTMFHELELSKSFIFEITRIFSDIEIDGARLTKEELEFLFKDIQVDAMELKYVWTQNVETISLPLKHRKINCGVADWTPFSSLLNMQCEELAVEWLIEKMTSENLLNFIGKWMEGNLENLKLLSIKISGHWWYQEQLLGVMNNAFSALNAMNLVVDPGDKMMTIQKHDGKKAKLIFESDNGLLYIVKFSVL